ncbi:MAG: PD40 domain-containing protein [bacterium]|nr:MAG: PD40 domain-containing protein [bacterium]
MKQRNRPYKFKGFFGRLPVIVYYNLLIILLALVNVQAQPQDFNHPELEWLSIETEHFIVHYHQGTERTANLVAKIAEEVYPHITGLYQIWPESKTEFIIRDTDDYSNGGAYFYENKIEIWAENMDYILRGTHNWLRDVVSHEFAHIISMQKSFKFGKNFPVGWFQVFGYEAERRPDVVRGFPNTLVSYPFSGITIPIWFAEGVAQFQSPSKRYDYRDSHREMILRDRVITDNLLDMNEMSTFGKNSIGNESAYNQGYAFVNFLTHTFGDTVVVQLAKQASSPTTLNFNTVLKKVSGVPADSIYSLWRDHLTETYSRRLSNVEKNVTEGNPLEDEGIGNIHPVFSPDGKSLAYLKSKSEYISANALVVMDLQTKEKRVVDGPVASSISWSPEGRYVVYSKQTELQVNGSSYYDIYVYDLKRKRNFRLTKGLRANNPDWSHNGKKLAFVVHSDGLTNLFTLTLDEFVWIKDRKLWQTLYYDLSEHRLIDEIPENRKDDWKRYYRKVEVWGRGVQQLTHYTDGRQIFHPRWSPADDYLLFDTSTDFCRDIAKIPAQGGETEFILNEIYDERYPVFSPSGEEIYYASDQTGIFNIYSYHLTTGKIEAHTNVLGGAFMPSVNERGDLAYALYKNQAYNIYWLQKVNELPIEALTYYENYAEVIPQIQANDRVYEALPAEPYKRRFGPVGIMPRLLIDYGTVKPGFYVYSNEIIDKMFFLGGFDVNLRGEYNIFGLTEFRLFKPTVFLEFYNQSAKIEDSYFDPDGFTESSDRIDVNFNLLEADFGLRSKFREYFSWELAYIYSLYRANIGTYSLYEYSTQQIYVVPEFRYSYLRGHALSLRLRRDKIFPDLDRAINPRKGYTIAFRYMHEWNQFLDDFTTEGGDIDEVYTSYNYNRYYIDLENYLPVPFTKHHALNVRLQGGYIDQDVNDFFYFFAGGFVGMKGFSYYSIGGKQMAIGTVTYRFPLARNLNLNIFNWYLDKIYLGTFYQYGNAWSSSSLDLGDFKSDIGIQLRLESFSWYMFPTRIFFEAAYPLESTRYQSIETEQVTEYKQDWRFYFGVLFDFDIRFDQLLRRIR